VLALDSGKEKERGNGKVVDVTKIAAAAAAVRTAPNKTNKEKK
jgi:hypothetical protein